ncbi:FAD-dependent monooxygenase [Halobacterium litoreum]|uniref:FAD-dependent monooxygenase n=1 Tax=Halobacterium litoreum TaxID=2039234 RepID=A0ABD5NC47_9EURY|nr:FAD-dependent monooxygenase [Halobacterium litoreum]UHH14237.1 FAD-dependent monooxygenase [Halobacterium litoreum]
MSGPSPDVAVVGGGICGLTTALGLERRGVDVRVYEAASAYRPVGAGLLVQANSLLALAELGVAERVKEVGNCLRDGAIRAPDGTDLRTIDLDRVERAEFGHGFVAVHRADLQRVLLDALDTTVELDKECVSVTDAADPTVAFADGTRVSADVVVGADGIDSAVRDAVAPDVETRALDGVVYRGVADVSLSDPHTTRGVEVWGDGTYTGGASLGEDSFYWFATRPGRAAAGTEPAGDALPGLRERYASFPDPIPAVVNALDPEDVFRSGLRDVPSLDRWVRGRVALAGDAAHGMLPFAGQGAAQSIEDAVVLADSLASYYDTEAALEEYECVRKPRADRVRAESHVLGRVGTSQSGVVAGLRNRLFSVVPDRVFRRLRRRRVADTTLTA